MRPSATSTAANGGTGPWPADRGVLGARILSSVILAPAVLLAVYQGAPFFEAMVALAAAVMAWEWTRLSCGRFDAGGVLLAVAGAAAALLGAAQPGWALVIVGLAALTPFIVGGPRDRSGRAWLSAGAPYIGIPVVALVWLRGEPEAGRETLFWLLAVVWATDIGAYAFGRTIGGPKLLPRVSPKKTWAGLAGGVLCAALVGAGTAGLLGTPVLPLALISGALAVVAQVGDFGESWVKRHFGVKDSSAIIPGHGGLLDRVDGVLAVAPAVVAICWYFGGGVLRWG